MDEQNNTQEVASPATNTPLVVAAVTAPQKHRVLHTVALTLLIASVGVMGSVVGYLYSERNNANSSSQISSTTKTQVIATIIPTPTTIATAVPTSSATPIPTQASTTKTYTDKDVKLQFNYDSSLTVVPGTYNPNSNDQVNGKKKIEVIKDSNTKLVFTYVDFATGCMPGDADDIDVLLTETASGLNIARKSTSYSTYTSEIIDQGSSACKILFGAANNGFFFVKIVTTNLNQDFSIFDQVLKSAKRI